MQGSIFIAHTKDFRGIGNIHHNNNINIYVELTWTANRVSRGRLSNNLLGHTVPPVKNPFLAAAPLSALWMVIGKYLIVSYSEHK